MKLFFQKNYRVILLLLLLNVGFLTLPFFSLTALAADTDEPDDGWWGMGKAVADLVWFACTALGGFLLWIAGSILDFSIEWLIIDMGSHLRGSLGVAVDQLWIVIRDIFNILFIFSLIYIGFVTILKSDDSQTKKLLANLIIAALLINFSLFFTKTIVDFTNIAAFQIYNLIQIDGAYTSDLIFRTDGISGAFLNVFNLETFGSKDGLNRDTIHYYNLIVIAVFVFTAMLLAALVFLVGAFMVIARFIALIIFMIFSPVMFVGMIFPKFQSYQDDWWKKFLGYAFFAPAYLFMLYLALTVIKATMFATGTTDGSFAGVYKPEAVNDSTFGFVMIYVMAIGFIYASLIVAKKMGVAGAETSLGITNAIGKNIRGNIQSFAGRNTVGRVGQWLGEKSEKLEGSPSGRTFKKVLTGLSLGAFDEQARRAAFSNMANAKFGGTRSRASQIEWNEKNLQLRAQQETLRQQKIDIKKGIKSNQNLTVGPNPDLTALERSVADANTSQLEELGAETLANIHVANAMSSSQYESIMKSTKLTETEKGMVAAARRAGAIKKLGGEIREQNQNGTYEDKKLATDKDIKTREIPNIHDATENQLKALGPELLAVGGNAGRLSPSQIEKVERLFTDSEINSIKASRTAQLKAWFANNATRHLVFDVNGKPKKDKDVAKLPREILIDPQTLQYLNTNILKAILDENTLNSSDRQSIKGYTRGINTYDEFYKTTQGQLF